MKELFNDGWSFLKTDKDAELSDTEGREFIPVRIPHDYLIGQSENLYEDSAGFYKKEFVIKPDPGKIYGLYFDGVYMEAKVYLNGVFSDEWKYGYVSHYVDLTSQLKDGVNTVIVSCRHIFPNSRWYSGAGIFRDVFFTEKNKTSFVTDGLYLSCTKLGDASYELKVNAKINRYAGSSDLVFSVSIDELSFREERSIKADEDKAFIRGVVHDVREWSVEEGVLYKVKLCLYDNSKNLIDEEEIRYGFRTISFDTDKGMFLNGKHIKINGVCEHHDLGALGSAYDHEAMKRKLKILRGMGVNAIRTSHNMPASDFLELADEEGFLVMDEAFDMWLRCKTKYDYGRFFKEWHERDLRSMVRRDRNHPCVFMWSIGNEIYDTHVDEGALELTKELAETVRSEDPYVNAVTVLCSNYMPWENTRKCADVLGFAGYNYGERYYDEHHDRFKDWYIFGSETGSTVQSRGIYHFPLSETVLCDDDAQCSSLGNSTTCWGAKNPEFCIITERDREYSLGQFLWTGFDYIGEPTPYQTKNSYFGQVDTAGFVKDSYYIYKAAWRDHKKDPFVHIFPYWDFNEGQIIDIRVASNAPRVELFLNGESLGIKDIDHRHGDRFSGDYSAEYRKGFLKALAYDEEGKVIAEDVRYSFGDPYSLRISSFEDKTYLKDDPSDMIFLTVESLDKDGHPVENANNRIYAEAEGNAYIAGMDNGDSTDQNEYKGYSRRLFSGKLLIMVRAKGEGSDRAVIKVFSEGLESASFNIEVRAADDKKIKGMSRCIETFPCSQTFDDGIWVRKIELKAEGEKNFRPGYQETEVRAEIFPENAFLSLRHLKWKTLAMDGCPSYVGQIIKCDDNMAIVRARSDGSFYLRCSVDNGTEYDKVISQIEFRAEGLGKQLIDPYEFVYGSLYSYNEGELGNGNEHGVATKPETRTVIGFEDMNFGSFGSDELCAEIFELEGDPCPVEIWDGIPEKDGSLMICQKIYHKPKIWNVYQKEDFKLDKRLKGISSIYFVFRQMIHLKGFRFKPEDKAFACLNGNDCDNIYGDSFIREGDIIKGIGNNVSVEYSNMDFGDKGAGSLEIKGYTHHPNNTIHLMIEDVKDPKMNRREIIEFRHSEKPETESFTFERVKGIKNIRLLFLPGSDFDLYEIRFKP
ncbi:MAG: DUF4982 domain-containing protein [Lachnospiraceae bacterium]|nr:DUF4982 domain-containing protein [Lachnospiraceae bacterium]